MNSGGNKKWTLRNVPAAAAIVEEARVAPRVAPIDWSLPVYVLHGEGLCAWPGKIETFGERGAARIAFTSADGETRIWWFDSNGRTPSDANCRASNIPAQIEPLQVAIDWTRPIEVEVDGGGSVVADVMRIDNGVAVVCWGAGSPGQRARVGIFRTDGAAIPLRVRNATPAFDPFAFFETRDGRPAALVALVDPPVGECSLVARVVTKPFGIEVIGHYRADGLPVFASGTEADGLVNVPAPPLTSPSAPAVEPPAPPPDLFDFLLPAMTREGSAVRNVRAEQLGLSCEVFVRSQGAWVRQLRDDLGRVNGSGEHPADLVNVDAPGGGLPAAATA